LSGELVTEEQPVGHLRNTLVAVIAGLEVEVGSPIVREILSVAAGGASGEVANIRIGHRDIEGVSSNDLVHMARWELAWIDKRVDAVNNDLRAAKSQHDSATGTASLWRGFGKRSKRKERSPKHLDLVRAR